MIDPDLVDLAAVTAVLLAAAGCLAFICTQTIRVLRRSRHQAALQPQRNYDEGFTQLQQSVDAIAVEIKRIAEAQRFSTRLLAEHGAVSSPPEEH